MIGEKIKELRKEANITQQELADLSGCTRQAISLIENRSREPSFELAQILLKSMGYHIYIGKNG